jgi:hypothetical protein
MARTQALAASTAVEAALIGPTRHVDVIAATADAAYLRVHDDAGTIMCLATPNAIRVPCAVVAVPPGARAALPSLSADERGTVGDGSLVVGGAAYRVTRWWRPPRPRGLGVVAPGTVAAAVHWLTGRVADPLDSPGRDAVADLMTSLVHGTSPAQAVARLLGRGPGLTPIGDDVLAAALVCLHALGSPAAGPLAAAVTTAAPDATTAVSAALLRHAARGECIPQLAELLDALAAGVADPAAGPLPRAAGGLLAVGHSSGAGLLHGVLIAVTAVHRARGGGRRIEARTTASQEAA